MTALLAALSGLTGQVLAADAHATRVTLCRVYGAINTRPPRNVNSPAGAGGAPNAGVALPLPGRDDPSVMRCTHTPLFVQPRRATIFGRRPPADAHQTLSCSKVGLRRPLCGCQPETCQVMAAG
jgi:hypothetical protein